MVLGAIFSYLNESSNPVASAECRRDLKTKTKEINEYLHDHTRLRRTIAHLAKVDIIPVDARTLTWNIGNVKVIALNQESELVKLLLTFYRGA